MEERKVYVVNEAVADPTVLGITSFGISLFTLSFANAGLVGPNAASIFVPLALITALMHYITCLNGFKKNEIFTALVFGIYGMFWNVFAFIFIFSAAKLFTIDGGELFWFCIAYTIFTVYVLIASLVTNKAVILTLFVLLLTFVCLDIGYAGAGNPAFVVYAGYTGIIDGLLALYISAMILLNTMYGRTVLPAGAVKR